MSHRQVIRVKFGRVDTTNVDQCPRCNGVGDEIIGSVLQTCGYCKGAGTNPHEQGYAYLTTEPLDVGDVVRVPGNWHKPEPQEATVIGHGSKYNGKIAPVLGVVERKANR